MAGGASLKSLAKSDRPRSTREVIFRLWSYLQPHRKDILAGSVWVVLSSASSAVTPALTGLIINLATTTAANHGDSRVLAGPGALLVGASVFGWLAQRQQILVLGTSGQRAVFDLRAAVFSAISGLDVAYFDSVESGDLMSRLINDINQVDSFLSQGFRRLLGAVVGLIATLAAMLWVDWRLAMVTLAVVPAMLGVTKLFGLIARRAFRTRQEAIGDVSATLAEEIGGIKVAQAFNRTGVNRTVFSERNAVNRDASVNAAVVSSAFSPVLGVISALATAMVAGVGGYLAASRLVSLGVVVAFFAYSRQFFNSISQMSSLYSDAQSALAGGERVFAVLDTPSGVVDAADARSMPKALGRVEFRDARFAYGAGPEILHGINLVVEPGQTLAIVGQTGAGKTTLINLVPRFYDVTGGCVLVDGSDVRELTRRSLRANFGIVLQEPFLFSGTVADNIRYGRLDASEDDIRRAAQLAGADALIAALPQGFDTVVTERGSTLSTGQRQLIAFARAVVGDPAILILDEATSSIDTRTEMLIQAGLRNILSHRTSLIIAHRLSTVRDADSIAVLDAGNVIEQGTYEELMARQGAFYRLHSAQFPSE